jgi:hypothetical protein
MGAIDGSPLLRYLVFEGYGDPEGGWHDFKGCFDSSEGAEAYAKGKKGTWYQVVDRETGCLKLSGERDGLESKWWDSIYATASRWEDDE